jgi:hypothetical protein
MLIPLADISEHRARRAQRASNEPTRHSNQRKKSQ